VTFDPERGGGAVGSGGQEDIPEVSFATREVYLEMRAPLVRQRPLTEALDLSLGARYSDFSSFGGHFTWQTGIRWQPVEAVGLRTNCRPTPTPRPIACSAATCLRQCGINCADRSRKNGWWG
jgi:hypothetical protein